MKKILLLILLVLFVSCDDDINPSVLLAPEPTPTAVTYSYYMPLVRENEKQNVTLPGLAKAYGQVTAANVSDLKIKWYYDYALRYPFPKDLGIEYIPFFWCDQYPSLKWPTDYNYFDQLAKLPDGYSGYLLFLNEPDLRGGDVDGWQCDRTPRQAAYIYKAVKEMCQRCVIVGPNVSHIDYLQNWKWLREFYEQIELLGLEPPDIAAVHDYTEQPTQKMITSLFILFSQFDDTPETMWVTEFATCNTDLAKQNIEYFKSDDRVERYAWFTGKGYPAAPCINLLSNDGLNQPVGDVYREAYP